MYNANCNCARHMMLAGRTHHDAMICIIDHCVTNPERGLVNKPYGNMDAISTDNEFEIMVKTDFDHVKCLGTRRSMTGSVVFLK